MITKIIVIALVFALYNYAKQRHLANMFLNKKSGIKIILSTYFMNVGIFIIAGIFEIFCFVIYIYPFLCFLEVKLIYNQKKLTAVFLLIAYNLNFLAINLIVMGILSRFGIDEIQFHSLVITILLSIPYIVLTNIFFKKIYIDLLLKDKKDSNFFLSIVSSIYIYTIIATHIVHLDILGNHIYTVGTQTGIAGIVLFLIAMSYTIVFSKLKITSYKFEEISSAIEEEEKEVEKLELELGKDSLTGLKDREAAEKSIKERLNRDEMFFVILFDMDGLKKVNDNFGHKEGDFYIKTAAEIISGTFSKESIARIGGDEILVVGSLKTKYSIKKKTVEIYKAVKDINKRYSKKYETSISYGIVFVDDEIKFDNRTLEKIINLADQRMYKFKKERRKEREQKKQTEIPKKMFFE